MVQIRLSADRNEIKANSKDLSYISIDLLDANGILNPKTENLLQFKIVWPGSIAAIENANPISAESIQENMRKAWRGRCLVIIKLEMKQGQITL